MLFQRKNQIRTEIHADDAKDDAPEDMAAQKYSDGQVSDDERKNQCEDRRDAVNTFCHVCVLLIPVPSAF